jgi:hypothetical protein
MNPERVRYADLIALPSLDEIKARKAAAKAANAHGSEPAAKEHSFVPASELLINIDPIHLEPTTLVSSEPGAKQLKSEPGPRQVNSEPGTEVRYRPRPMVLAQDGHTKSEQAVYVAMWTRGKEHDEVSKIIRVGVATIARLARVGETQARISIRSLIAKLAVEETSGADCARGEGKTYRVFSYSEIIRRRRADGWTHVIRRTSSAKLIRSSEPGTEVKTEPGAELGTPGAKLGEVPNRDPGTVLNRVLRVKQEKGEEPSSSGIVDIQRAISPYLTMDDDAILRILESCRQKDAGATLEEISHFAGVSAAKIARQRNVDNPAGLLIKQVARFFPGTELEAYRARKAQEAARSSEVARQVLEDPESSPELKEWAQAQIP